MQIMQFVPIMLASWLLAFSGMLISAPASNAQEFVPKQSGSACSSGGKQIIIYHINGVWTDTASAFLSTEALNDFLIYGWTGEGYTPIRSLLPTTYASDKVCLVVALLRNPSGGKLQDLLESAHQLDQLEPKDFWSTLGDSLQGALNPSTLKLLERLSVIATDKGIIDNASIQNHATKIAADIRDRCASVLLVPHSQGNLYAHMAYEKLTQDSSVSSLLANTLRVVGVGSPDEDFASSYRNIYSWKTNHSDVLMGDNVPLLFPLTLSNDGLVRQLHGSLYEANTAWTSSGLTEWFAGSLGHGFAGYLRFQPSQNDIRTALANAFFGLSLESNCTPDPGFTARATAVTSYQIGGLSDYKETNTIPQGGTLTFSATSFAPSQGEHLLEANATLNVERTQKGKIAVVGNTLLYYNQAFFGGYATSSVNITERLIVTAPGKNGQSGILLITPVASGTLDCPATQTNGSSFAAVVYNFGFHGDATNSILTGDYIATCLADKSKPQGQPQLGTFRIPFTYGIPLSVKVSVYLESSSNGVAVNGTLTATGSLTFGYDQTSFTIENPPPDASIQF